MGRINTAFKSKVFLWSGDKAAWHFIGVPKKESLKIKESYKAPRRGFGAVPVTVTIGETTWKTSIFPDSRSGCYILPLKATVRKKEDIYADDSVSVQLVVGA